MTSISFDPVAQRYDATRGYPQEVARQIAEAIDGAADGNAQTRFLEVGVGTGRVALPLAALGRNYAGIDISENMLSQLENKLRTTGWQEESLSWGSLPDEVMERKLDVQRFLHQEKQATMRLVKADMTDIPFYDHSFDVVIAVHVFHLVSDWQKALQEVVRILRPGGLLLRCGNGNWHKQWETGRGDIRKQWSKIVQELGGEVSRPGASERTVTAWLQEQGFQTEQWEVLRWQKTITPRAIFEGVAQRLWSNTWSVPDAIFALSVERLQQWMDEQYGTAIDEVSTEEECLVLSRTRV
ncbi:MAG TPA: class I SAM-dependent methyltransferase [Ktedonobacteraceae bacterium]|nr:class I SAM-dependent methyltransferase [Ktedonobacteraceae bacterium]